MKRIVILFLFLSALGFSQTPNFEKFDKYLDILFKNNKFMGNIALAKEGAIFHKSVVGYQYINYNNKKMASSDSKYKIGSITKTFTAAMIFQLIEEGKLSLKTPLSKFYPKIKNAKQITVDHLLTHSSGLFNITNAAQFGTWKNKPATTEVMVSRIKTFEPNFLPGEKEEYSNTNYLLLGYIIEKLDGEPYSKAVQKRIINKLKLKDTYYGGAINIHENECQSYHFRNNIWEQSGETHMSLPGGAGGLVSTSSDLVVFIEALFSGKLVSEASIKKMVTTSEGGMGKGIHHTNFQGIDIYGHDGGIDGFQSMLLYAPSLKMGISLTSNGMSYEKMGIIQTAFKASMGMDVEMPIFEGIDISAEQVKKYVGVYESGDVPYDLVFEANGKILKGAPEGSNLKDLIPTKKDEFTLDALKITLNFNLKEKTLLFKQGDNPVIKFTKKQ